MKITTVIDKTREEEVVIFTHGESDLAERIRQLVGEKETIIGYRGEDMMIVDPSVAFCFFTEGGATYALLPEGKYRVREPLYKIEERVGGAFLRINQSSIVRVSAVVGFRASIGGSLAVVLKGGHTDYVSRRQIKTVKERFGIK